ncbi:hypothetical protein K456DRAFT_315396 [Colletotrichum gloeosporioides 23]|nr:hypothetical protein K456DRAFT_315396 [Colletotrichum gloeosporioides 23]
MTSSPQRQAATWLSELQLFTLLGCAKALLDISPQRPVRGVEVDLLWRTKSRCRSTLARAKMFQTAPQLPKPTCVYALRPTCRFPSLLGKLDVVNSGWSD